MIESYSQLLEDCYIHQNIINIQAPNISLVEIGAFDGITYSNTLMLENTLNTPPAFLVEASPRSAALARRNRPNSKVLEIAVSSDFGVAEFAGDAAVSGLTENFTSEYINRWAVDKFDRHKCLTAPMHAVQEVIDRPFIDFLSIDVQGAERVILETTNWQQPIGTICIELEGHRPADDKACREILISNGFIFVQRLLISEVWINPGYERAQHLYDINSKVDFNRYALKVYAEKHLQSLLHCFL